MAYLIRVTPAAERSLARLDKSIRQRLSDAIDRLAENPRPPGIKKLSGARDLWRIRVGDYRVIYSILDRELLVLVVSVGHRGDVYR